MSIRGEQYIPWPKKGQKLFLSREDWWHNACLNFVQDKCPAYAEGYKKGADILADYAKEHRQQLDFIIYPIVFLYRQCVELRLKIIIKYGNPLLDNSKPFPTTHDLRKLWDICRPIIRHVWPDGPEEDLEAVDEYIAEFCSVDPTSEGFRYPEDRKGFALVEDLRHINIDNLSRAMERLDSLLSGVGMSFAEFLQDECDIEGRH